MNTRTVAILVLASIGVPRVAGAQGIYEPFHLQPILPRTGVLGELRPTIAEISSNDHDPHFGIGWLLEGRFALGQIHAAMGLPWAIGFVEDSDTIKAGNFELGGGYGALLGTGGGRWGVGSRISLPTGGTGVPAAAGIAGRPYGSERHLPESTTIRMFADVGTDDGGFVGQAEGGLDFWIPEAGVDNELLFRFGLLAGYHLAPRTILMTELVWKDSLTTGEGLVGDGQFSFQPGVRFAVATLDFGVYMTIPVDKPLGGEAFAFGLQALWNPR